MEGQQEANFQLLEQAHCYAPFALPEVPERQQVAAAFQQFLMAQGQVSSDDQRTLIAEQMNLRFEIQDLAEPASFLGKSREFMNWVDTKFVPSQVSISYPIRSLLDGRLFESSVDIYMETNAGTVVLLLSKFIGDGKGRLRYLKGLSPTVQVMKQILREKNGKLAVSAWVVFVIYGEAVELKA